VACKEGKIMNERIVIIIKQMPAVNAAFDTVTFLKSIS
jgi:hypothetical protein